MRGRRVLRSQRDTGTQVPVPGKKEVGIEGSEDTGTWDPSGPDLLSTRKERKGPEMRSKRK